MWDYKNSEELKQNIEHKAFEALVSMLRKEYDITIEFVRDMEYPFETQLILKQFGEEINRRSL